MRPPCIIEGCDAPNAGRGWCQKHWQRWRKYGDPLFVKQRGVDWQLRSDCSIEGCESRAHAHTYCIRHLYHWRRYGDPLHEPKITGRPLKGDVPTFTTIHRRLTTQRGRAAEHACVDCDDQAVDWSYNNADPDEHFDPHGTAYSLDLTNYAPRCRPCHRRFDRAGDRARNERGQFTKGAMQ